MPFKFLLGAVLTVLLTVPAYAETLTLEATPEGAPEITNVLTIDDFQGCSFEALEAISIFEMSSAGMPRFTNAENYIAGQERKPATFEVDSSFDGDLKYYTMENGTCVLKSAPRTLAKTKTVYKFGIPVPQKISGLMYTHYSQQGGMFVGSTPAQDGEILYYRYTNIIPATDVIKFPNGNTVNFTFPIKPALPAQ